ncbi:hypothetical protein TSMEX_007398 [Taenia solium]|eukprot:TsM_000161700 transcript=TsM_000161700 gene=TsM_000161700
MARCQVAASVNPHVFKGSVAGERLRFSALSSNSPSSRYGCGYYA